MEERLGVFRMPSHLVEDRIGKHHKLRPKTILESQSDASSALDVTRAYHEQTKHRPFRFATALGYMDWATQPNPFRRYEGALVLPLDGLTRSAQRLPLKRFHAESASAS